MPDLVVVADPADDPSDTRRGQRGERIGRAIRGPGGERGIGKVARRIESLRQPIDGGIQITWNVTVDIEGAEKPALVAEWLIRALF